MESKDMFSKALYRLTSVWLCLLLVCRGWTSKPPSTDNSISQKFPTRQQLIALMGVTDSHDRTSVDPLKLKRTLLQIFEADGDIEGNLYACPESLEPLSIRTRMYGFVTEKYLLEQKFGAKYAVNSDYLDLVTAVGTTDQSSSRLGQAAFQSPLLSSFYERGYRQNFQNFGFPGIEMEYEEAENLFVKAKSTKVVLDLSCGSGFMTRRFLRSQKFSRVIAADLSPSMLAETRRNCLAENLMPPELVRCDSAKLPFRSNSIDAVHAGAAMHCWPEIEQSLSEVYRVLKPGGAFFATTFAQRRFLKRSVARDQGFSVFTSAQEVEELVQKAGFQQAGGCCQVRTEGSRCVVVKALKAPADPAILL